MSASRLLVPAPDAEPWPSLGGQVCEWIEERLVHGPGDVLGDPIELTSEMRLLLWRAYELYPAGHEQAGRRRFKRVVYSRRKGTAKTELAAWVAIAELDDEAPVRFDGWDAAGEPVGRGIRDPYLPMVAVTEEQSSDLAYGAAYAILERCELGNKYVIGVEQIVPRDPAARGKMQALASAPGARDGARTTFQHFDETHHFVSARLKGAHAMMLRNAPKRMAADAWSLETTTMYAPGEDSVAEDSHKYAEAVDAGLIDDPRLLFDHLQAAETHKIETVGGLREAIIEASGDALAWTSVEDVAAQFRDPTADKNELRRYWLNQRRRSSKRWLPEDVVEARIDREREVEDDEPIVLAFDGSYSRDSTALVAATIEERPHVFVVAAWEKPPNVSRWRTPRGDVEAELEQALERWRVLELAPDPPGWHREIEEWEESYDVVVRFETNQPSRMGPAIDAFEQALRGAGRDDDGELELGDLADGSLTLDGDPRLLRHIANAVAKRRGPHTLIGKEHPDSPLKIDLAVGAVIAYNRAAWHYAESQREQPAWRPV